MSGVEGFTLKILVSSWMSVENKLLEKINRINLFLKHKTMTLSFCHNIQSKIINDLNINTEKKLYPTINNLFINGISNILSKEMFNKLNKNQINFLYNNSSIDSEIYFNLSNDINV